MARAAVLLLLVCAPGCVRLDEPVSFVCRTDADCESGQKCFDEHLGEGPRCLPQSFVIDNGGACARDSECESGTCCPTGTPDVFVCDDRCELLGAGEACRWSAICASGSCNGARCTDCAESDDACREAVCGFTSCGTVAGHSCGSCAEGEYCGDTGRCLDVCAQHECGMHDGVDCGSCGEGARCNGGTCEPACVNVECGADQGVDCGSCAQRNYCDASGRCQPGCDGMECGTDANGAHCGECEGLAVCEGGTCVAGSCFPGAFHCDANSLFECSDDGTARSLVEACAGETFCDADARSCQDRLCETGEPICDGAHWTVCNADGSGGEPGGRDCGAGGVDCTELGCGTQRVWDPVGSFADQERANGIFVTGAYVSVTTDARILDIHQRVIAYDAGFTLRYFVYESDTLQGTYRRILLVDGEPAVPTGSPRTATAGGVYDLALELKAGKHYLIGATTDVEQAYDIAYSEFGVAHPQTLHFGQTTRGYRANALPPETFEGRPATEDAVYAQRVRSIVLAP